MATEKHKYDHYNNITVSAVYFRSENNSILLPWILIFGTQFDHGFYFQSCHG